MYLCIFVDDKNIFINKELLYYNKVVFFFCYEQSFKIIDNILVLYCVKLNYLMNYIICEIICVVIQGIYKYIID